MKKTVFITTAALTICLLCTAVVTADSRNFSAKDLADFSKGELIYERALNDPEDVSDWWMEGPGKVEFKDGWMEMYSPGEKYHHVFWSPVELPPSFIAEWEVQNKNPQGGLCIVFFAARANNGKAIDDPSLPKRDGTFSQYTKGAIGSYHISYYANNPREFLRENANLRKNPGFNLVQKGGPAIARESTEKHKLTLIKKDGQILMFLDGEKIIDWTDDGKTFGPVHEGGKIGFRQMKWTRFAYRDLKVWTIKDN